MILVLTGMPGGLAVGEPQKDIEVLDYSTDFFPLERPRYLMGEA